MVRDDDMLVYLRNPVNIIEHPAEDRILPDLQQRLRKVLCQLPQPSGIPSSYNNILHAYTNLAPSSGFTQNT